MRQDFDPEMFAWEIGEQWKKLFLVGFAALIKPATIDQLVVGLMFSLTFMLLLAICSPYRQVRHCPYVCVALSPSVACCPRPCPV